jgi:hypothetical protein
MIWLAVVGLAVAVLAYLRHSRVTHERKLNVFVHALSLDDSYPSCHVRNAEAYRW